MRRDFASFPSVRFNRSKFPMPHGVKTSMSTGFLYPVEFREVLPGDTFSCKSSVAARVSTAFLRPVVDNLVMDVYHFFVPLRLVCKDVESVFGDPNPGQYSLGSLASFPVTGGTMTVSEKTVYDYLGLPTGTLPKGLNVLPARAFALIWNEWFRNENVIDETWINKTMTVSTDDYANNYDWSANNYTGKLPRVSRKKDYFSSCLPKPQKGDQVNVPLVGTAPVRGNGKSLGLEYYKSISVSPYSQKVQAGLIHGRYVGNLDPDNTENGLFASTTAFGKDVAAGPPGSNTQLDDSVSIYGASAGVTTDPTKSGLVADLSGLSSVSINDLRFLFQLQKMLERDAIYGSRYNEYILGHYGVSSPDSRLQFTEYLGGGRFPITLQEVPQTAPTSGGSALGSVAASSLTNGFSSYSKGFTEHGYIFTVACIRQLGHTYQQGVPRAFMKEDRNDIYDPLYNNLSYQPVYRTELYVDSNDTGYKDNVFGYNEAFADYRFCPSRVTGEMRSSATNSFDVWHFADVYSNAPVLSADFINEPATFVDRTLAAPSSSVDQFLVDFWFDETAIRVMSAYAIPGLIDHH